MRKEKSTTKLKKKGRKIRAVVLGKLEQVRMKNKRNSLMEVK